jgi:TetR/AcrR family transcriptional regulator, transcriptional repressor for nem operon
MTMARPREFDIDEATEKAVEVFWKKGYDGAALPDLLDGMGIARGSLYKAFGDKKKLYLHVLKRYDEVAVAGAVELLTDRSEPDGGKRIARLFQSIVDAVINGDHRGCLMCNAAAGPASEDPDISRVVSRMLARMTEAFAAALLDSQHAQQSTKSDREAEAESLTASYVGLRILAKSGAPVDRLRAAAGAAIKGALPPAQP